MEIVKKNMIIILNQEDIMKKINIKKFILKVMIMIVIKENILNLLIKNVEK